MPDGKKNRGLALVLSYKMLASGPELTDESLRLAYILGWCVEIVSTVDVRLKTTSALPVETVIDRSERKPTVGRSLLRKSLFCLNDANNEFAPYS